MKLILDTKQEVGLAIAYAMRNEIPDHLVELLKNYYRLVDVIDFPVQRVFESSRTKRAKIFLRDAGICYLCGNAIREGEEDFRLALTLDHIVPRSKGGKNAASNLKAAHYYCNLIKGDQLLTPELMDAIAENYAAKFNPTTVKGDQ